MPSYFSKLNQKIFCKNIKPNNDTAIGRSHVELIKSCMH